MSADREQKRAKDRANLGTGKYLPVSSESQWLRDFLTPIQFTWAALLENPLLSKSFSHLLTPPLKP